ncbi:hypothetical protein ABZ632_25810 [Streptomyces albidoflavus]|uniref:hypothetical protein n=1 Tax=Streptomyces TaxID=1883 RepID=UPI001FFED4F5|nr:hypothetical protein [Streptomyces sp. WAC00276]MCK2141655.1 hypothetical protein [Streptomyces sp. WAC00276]
MATPVFIDEVTEAELAELDLDIQMYLSGPVGGMEPMTPTHGSQCESSNSATSCFATNGCNPSCC